MEETHMVFKPNLKVYICPKCRFVLPPAKPFGLPLFVRRPTCPKCGGTMLTPGEAALAYLGKRIIGWLSKG